MRAGKAMDHLALEHPRFSPTNRSSEDLDIAMSAAARLLAATPAPGPPLWPVGDGLLTSARGRSKQESMNARLAAGEHPWDMISLKAAIQAARPGGLIPALQSIARGKPCKLCHHSIQSRSVNSADMLQTRSRLIAQAGMGTAAQLQHQHQPAVPGSSLRLGDLHEAPLIALALLQGRAT